MRIITDVRTTDERFDRLVLAVGCFDGVHLGHRQIVAALIEEAARIGGLPAVMTLEPHPRQYFSPKNAPNILTPNPVKFRLLEMLGVRVAYVLPFDAATAAMTPEQFIRHILIDRCNIKGIVAGHDFAFGRGAGGDYTHLEEAARQHGFSARQVPPLIIGGQRVSSTLIREHVLQGEVEDLPVYLGRHYSLTGLVGPGRGIGRTLGFPTANLEVGACAVPAHGVYAAKAIVNGAEYLSAVNIGIAPTIRNEQTLVEAHLLDFSGDIGGAEMEVRFFRHMRPERKFASREALMDAIAGDIISIRNYFS